MLLKNVHADLLQLANEQIAEHSQRFFKTGKGEYGEGDIFLGIRVPVLRKLVKKYRGISIAEVRRLLHSKFHEERLLAVLMLVHLFKSGNEREQKLIFDSYLETQDLLIIGT